MIRNINTERTKYLRKYPDVGVKFLHGEVIEIISPKIEEKQQIALSIYKEMKFLVDFQREYWRQEKDGTYSIPVISWQKDHVIQILESGNNSEICQILEGIAKKIGIV